MGSNQTTVTVVALGGATAFILLYSAQLIAGLAAGHDIQFPTGLESALGTVFTALFAWLMPADVLSKISRRTRPPKEGP